MVFVKDDHRAVDLFDRALELASTPSLFLFVGLVPGNLPSGHLERFKGRLFNKLAQGLSRCRAASVQWSLRVLENVSAESAANHLIEAYGPDRILLGRGTARRCFSTRLATLDSAVERIP